MYMISTTNAPQAIGPYSQAVISNGLIFTSGQIALTPEGEMAAEDVKVQARQVLTNLKAVLEAGGSNLNNVIKTTMFLADMQYFAEANEVYAEFFGSHKPARSTIAVKTLPKNAMVEIECIAIV